MALNISKGNMYDFVTHTWNVIKGECPHRCLYCYMKRWGTQKPLWFDEKELKTNFGKDNHIFVGSSCDMFADSIPFRWIEDVVSKCSCDLHNKFFFQSKNPEMMRLALYDKMFEQDVSVCTTIESNRRYEAMGDAPSIESRVEHMSRMPDHFHRYVTIEPIMDFDIRTLVGLIRRCAPKQVNIGADSGGNKLCEPPHGKIRELVAELEKFTRIHHKRNIERLMYK